MSAPIAAATVAALALASGATQPDQRDQPDQPDPRPTNARETCSGRSEADFPGAFTNERNLVVGPLVMIGAAAQTDAVTVREIGGNKFPLIVKAGHRVTVRLARSARETAGLAYGPLPQGKTRLRDTYRSVTFVACRRGKPTRRYRPQGPADSYADGVNVTFWSGGVLTREPACVPLNVFVDGQRPPRRVQIPLGESCDPPEAGE
jgi:hypothetical protein